MKPSIFTSYLPSHLFLESSGYSLFICLFIHLFCQKANTGSDICPDVTLHVHITALCKPPTLKAVMKLEMIDFCC